MDSFIKGVAVFKDSTKEGKRVLELSRGLNIITGHSKTGKSAILDIIDWCLGSKDCTIPKGVITDFAKVYVVLIYIKGVNLLLARKGSVTGKKYIHVKHVSDHISINDIALVDINEKNFVKVNEGLEIINEAIDLSLGNGRLVDVDFKIPNVTIRSALPFNFQHQDIISSNSRLFYLEPTKNHFPILAGWFNSEYYIVLETIGKINKAVKSLSSKNEKAKKENFKLEFNLKSALRTYYKLIGIEFKENWTVEYCLSRIENLEGFNKQEFSNDLQKRQDDLERIIEVHQLELIRINRNLSKVQIQENFGDEYSLFVERYKKRSESFSVNSEYVCPICEKPNEKLSVEALDILDAKSWLKNELIQIPSQVRSISEDVLKFKEEKTQVLQKLSELKREHKENKEIIGKILSNKNLNEEKQKAQWRTKTEADIYLRRQLPVYDKVLDEHGAQLGILEEKKRTYNELERYERAKLIIEDKMSLIVELLDFEHKPPQLFFEINPQKQDNYKLYHNKLGDERVFLRQIGSASNGLACHIGMFLSFLYYFTKQPNSKVPSFLFFDQPSQVYFPSGTDNNDLLKVGQIYNTILDEIKTIEDETGICPQIIVADHIKDLGEETVKLYGHYFKADWRDGKGFI